MNSWHFKDQKKNVKHGKTKIKILNKTQSSQQTQKFINRQGFSQQLHLLKFNFKNVQQVKMDTIYDDLLETTPENVNINLPTMDLTQAPEIQLMCRYRLLQRATRRRDRQLSLIHAYLLGELLDQTTDRHQHGFLSNQLSPYYKQACMRTYYLFERTGIEQIMRTKKTTLRSIAKLKANEFKVLIGSQLVELAD